jgi:hypothetical protein
LIEWLGRAEGDKDRAGVSSEAFSPVLQIINRTSQVYQSAVQFVNIDSASLSATI